MSQRVSFSQRGVAKAPLEAGGPAPTPASLGLDDEAVRREIKLLVLGQPAQCLCWTNACQFVDLVDEALRTQPSRQAVAAWEPMQKDVSRSVLHVCQYPFGVDTVDNKESCGCLVALTLALCLASLQELSLEHSVQEF